MNAAYMKNDCALEMLEHHNPPPLKKSRPEIFEVMWVDNLNEKKVCIVYAFEYKSEN